MISSNASKRASKSLRCASIHSASALRPRFPSLQVLTRPTFCVTTSPPVQNLDVLLHAGQRHLELVRETGDRRVRSAKLIDDPAAGRIGQRRKRAIEGRTYILNHVVQCLTCSRRKRKRPELSLPQTGHSRSCTAAAAVKNRLLRVQKRTFEPLMNECQLSAPAPRKQSAG